MNKTFHHLLMVNQAIFQKKILNELIKIGLTPGQPKVLEYLNQNDGSIQKDIAHGCHIDPATLTGILDRMEEKNLIERKSINGNRRSSHVYLTECGKKYSEDVLKVFIKEENIAFKGIDKYEQTQFIDILYKIYSNMTDMEETNE